MTTSDTPPSILLIVSDPTGGGTERYFGSIPPPMSWTIPGRVHPKRPVIDRRGSDKVRTLMGSVADRVRRISCGL